MSLPRPALAAALLAVLLSAAAGPVRGQEAAAPARGAALFEQHCAVCHGPQGRGDGPVVEQLDPLPRDFGQGTFRIVSTLNRRPTDRDLRGTIAFGMPGSAMPAYAHLPSSDIDALVLFVREAAVRSRSQALLRAPGPWEALDPQGAAAQARAEAAAALAPGALAPVGPAPPVTDELLAHGAGVYAEHCASCHGPQGRGRVRRDFVDDRGIPTPPRDFTAGLFRGGDDPVELARRTVLGMPGTAMPAFDLDERDLWGVVHHVRSLVEPGATERARLTRRTLTVLAVEGPLRTDPSAPVWQGAAEAHLPLAPLRWHDDRVEGVRVRALHDGHRLAFRIAWQVAAAAGQQVTPHEGDGVAVSLSREDEPPLFPRAAGAPGAIDAWTWKLGMVEELPIRGGEIEDEAQAARNVVGEARFTGAGWEVVLVRELSSPGDVSFRPGELGRVSFLVWDGRAQAERDEARSFSVWHELLLQE